MPLLYSKRPSKSQMRVQMRGCNISDCEMNACTKFPKWSQMGMDHRQGAVNTGVTRVNKVILRVKKGHKI